ncbi:MAG: glycosyltransferase family 39 protein [Anaerolineae bacterium]|nr:glycosyltransferase family 39 protein [Anaerolineae bacterium]
MNKNRDSILTNRKTFHYTLLLLIVLLGCVLRFYKLGEWSFWGDEMFTVGGREDGFNYTFIRQSVSMTLIQFLVAWLGITEWNARLIPALFGMVSIPVLYLLVRKMFDPVVGLAAAILLAVSPWHLYWSQNARFYVPLLLFYTVALFAFYYGFEKDKPWYLVVSLLFLGLATKERLLALFFVPIVTSYLLLIIVLPFEKPTGLRWRNIAIFFLPGVVAGGFFVGPYVQNLSGWMEGFGYVNNDPVWIMLGVIYYIGLVVIGFAALGAVYFLVQKNRAVLLLSLGAVVPLFSIMGLSLFHYTANRYVFISLTCWLVLAALSTVELYRQSPKNVKILAMGALLLLIITPLSEDALYFKYQNGNRDNWRGAFEFVKHHKSPQDLVVAINPELGNFYLEEKILNWTSIDPNTLDDSENRLWFVEDMVAQEVYPEIHDWLTENARLVANYDVHAQARNFQMRVYLYEPVKVYQDFAQ